jgi:Tat protein secretion system quality control protein TatD with DNase activity
MDAAARVLNRRRVALLVLAVLFAPGAGGADGSRAERPPAVAFVDAHVHLNDVTMQLEMMAENDITQAVVFWGRASDNAAVLAAARAHPDKFIPFVSVSPERREYRELWRREDPQLLETLEAALRDGTFRGIGEISVAHFPSPGFPEADFDPVGVLMTGIMRLAHRHRLPVLIHCEITRLAEFESLLRAHREVQVIWAHGGYTPYFLARRLLERHPNLHYELSARTWRHHPRSPEYTIFMTDTEVWPQWRALIEAMPTRFIVGTDATQRTRASDQERIDSVRRLLAQLDESTRDAVARRNLLRLVGKAD